MLLFTISISDSGVNPQLSTPAPADKKKIAARQGAAGAKGMGTTFFKGLPLTHEIRGILPTDMRCSACIEDYP